MEHGRGLTEKYSTRGNQEMVKKLKEEIATYERGALFGCVNKDALSLS